MIVTSLGLMDGTGAGAGAGEGVGAGEGTNGLFGINSFDCATAAKLDEEKEEDELFPFVTVGPLLTVVVVVTGGDSG